MTTTADVLESSLTDLGGVPLSETAEGGALTAALAERIMPQTGVSAFNSSI